MSEPAQGRGAQKDGGLRYRLVVARTDGSTQVVQLSDSAISVGRASDNDISVNEAAVSRLHCVISLAGGRPSLADQGSTNGTFLNGRKVMHAWLGLDDEVRVGKTTMRLELAEQTGVRATPLPYHDARPSPPPWMGSTPEDSRARLEIVYRLGALLSSTGDVESAAEAVIDLLLEAFPFERAFVLLSDGGSTPDHLRTVASRRRGGVEAPVGEPSRTVTEMALSSARALHNIDIETDQTLSKSTSLLNARTRAVLCAPLLHGDEVMGLLYGDAPSCPDTASLEEGVPLFDAIAHQASLALGRAMLHADLVRKNETLRERNLRLDDLSRDLEERVRDKTILAETRAAELAIRLRELETLHTARDTMARALVHDIRNLVSCVTSNLSFLRELVPAETEGNSAAEEALEASLQIVSMAEDVLSVSRMEAGALELSLKPHKLADLLEAAARRHAGKARDYGVGLSVDRPEAGLTITADESLLGRVLDNLLANGLRHAPSGGNVVLSGGGSGRNVQLVVTDDGPGVPEEERARIFDEWHQLGARGFGNNGIGLHFCRLAVEAHGGSIWVEGEPGNNSFVVSLPSLRPGLDLENTVAERPTAMDVLIGGFPPTVPRPKVPLAVPPLVPGSREPEGSGGDA